MKCSKARNLNLNSDIFSTDLLLCFESKPKGTYQSSHPTKLNSGGKFQLEFLKFSFVSESILSL